MRNNFNEYHEYIKYAENENFKIVDFSESNETFLLLNNEMLRRLSLYADDTAKEHYKISQFIANCWTNCNEIEVIYVHSFFFFIYFFKISSYYSF